MPRSVLDESQIHPAVRERVAGHHAALVQQVQAAIAQHAVVVVGMAQNPFVKKAREALDGAGVRFTYIEYGSYLSNWKERLAIKLWSGWPTFPQVFVRGALLGGEDLTKAALSDGSLRELLAKPKS